MKFEEAFVTSSSPKGEGGEGESIINFSDEKVNNLSVEEKKCYDSANAIGLNLRTFNECVKAGSEMADPVDLYDGLWFEGELTALYADTNLGKSILAVQIGEAVAQKGFKTIYVDIELSDKGVEKRARHEDGTLHEFPDNFLRLTIDFEKILQQEELDDEGMKLLDRIEAVVRYYDAKALIIDNLTAICASMESGEAAVKLVNRLIQMRNNNNLSILFLCHTPKLDRSQPLTRDSMAGSKRIISLVDSAFAIGQSINDPLTRYIKQTKVRLDEYKYHDNNVLVCHVERRDGLLQFVSDFTTREIYLLTAKKEGDKGVDEKIKQMHLAGYSFRKIAKDLNLSRYHICKRLEEMGLGSEEGER